MTAKTGKILVIDDDLDVLTAAQLLLKRHFSLVLTDDNPQHIPEHLNDNDWDVILLDMNFEIGANSGQEGLDWLSFILNKQPNTLVILMTAYGAVDTAVKAIKLGAIDFILKPWHNERLLTTVSTAMRLKESRAEVQHLKSRQREISPVPVSSEIIGTSAAMRQIHDFISRAAPTDANVLILGDNGTGKELIAREIHRQSSRKEEVLITVDLGSVSESLFESELFGHKKGAFTGAHSDRIGRFQAASKGTLFLDEIGNLPHHLQSKLLSVLEQREVLPLGSNTPVPIDVRLICATNMPLKKMISEGSFREDLFYRINTVEIRLPPLKDRAEDIPILLEHFIVFYSHKYKLTEKTISAPEMEKLLSYHWPGNIRELRHAVERALIMGSSDELKANELLVTSDSIAPQAMETDSLNLDEVENSVIQKALKKNQGNISHAAKELGITRTSLYRRMEKYGL